MTLFLTRKYPPSRGGMETFSYELTSRWDNDAQPNNGPNKRVIHHGSRQSDILWALPLLALQGAFYARSADTIHLGDLVLSPIARFLKLFSSTPIVATVHGLELTYNNLNGIYGALIRSGLSSIDRFVCVSENTSELLQQLGIDPSRISIITHGVEVERITHDDARTAAASTLQLDETAQRSTWLLTVGRLVKRKGVEWFIRDVLPQLKDSNFQYLIASDGPEHAAIKKAIDDTNQSERIHILGNVPDVLLQQLYAGSDIFVMPNIAVPQDVEGFGFVAVEAAAHGLPVLASDIDGIPAAIHHKQNGILLPATDSAAYEKIIRLFVEDEQTRTAFGAKAAEYTATHFNWDSIVEQYATLFAELAEKQTSQ